MVEDIIKILHVVRDYLNYFLILMILLQETEIQNLFKITYCKGAFANIYRLLLFNLILLTLAFLYGLIDLCTSDLFLSVAILRGVDYIWCLCVNEITALIILENLDFLWAVLYRKPFDIPNFAERQPNTKVVPDSLFGNSMLFALFLILHDQSETFLLEHSAALLRIFVLKLVEHLVLELYFMFTEFESSLCLQPLKCTIHLISSLSKGSLIKSLLRFIQLFKLSMLFYFDFPFEALLLAIVFITDFLQVITYAYRWVWFIFNLV